jgi:outer membrane protein assembly factor BamD
LPPASPVAGLPAVAMPALLPLPSSPRATHWVGGRAAIVALTLAAALSGCSGAEVAGEKPADASQKLYQEAMEQLANGTLIEAEQSFLRLSRLPNYLPVVALARLRLGDTQYEAQRYDEAIDTFLTFIQRHEGNDNVPYAQFMVAKAHVALMPSSLWILPPVYEMDLTAVVTARQQLEKFLRLYPRSRYATEAMQLRAQCVATQEAHTDYVVQFYRDRKAWSGVVFRLHQALQSSEQRAHTLPRYLLLAEAYEQLLWRQRATELWQAIASRWPASPEAQRAPAALQRLRQAMDAARKKGQPAEMPKDLPPMASIKPETLDADVAPASGA